MPTKAKSIERRNGDYRMTVSMDEVSYRQCQEMADDDGLNNMSALIRMLVRQGYRLRKQQQQQEV
jgi:hypothetical protein